MQYGVAVETDLDELIRAVNGNIAEGWRPTGSMVVYQHLGQNRFAQPMIRYGADIPRPDIEAAARNLGALMIARQGGKV